LFFKRELLEVLVLEGGICCNEINFLYRGAGGRHNGDSVPRGNGGKGDVK